MGIFHVVAAAAFFANRHLTVSLAQFTVFFELHFTLGEFSF